MSDSNKDYGILINKDIKLYRNYFKEMTRLIGINVKYRAPLKEYKNFDGHGDLDSLYTKEITVGCIFEDHPDQKSLKKMGWVSELQEGSSLIHVPYDLPNLQVGALFTIPSGIDNAEGRVFRVISMKNIMIFPATITCEIAPEYEDIDEPVMHTDFKNDNFTLLNDLEEDD